MVFSPTTAWVVSAVTPWAARTVAASPIRLGQLC
jgi:hypothetical protein